MISHISLRQFRSYIEAQFEFSDGVNIVVGPNASGKTNLLEAVLVLATGRSFRAKDIELVHHEKPWARLDAKLESSTRVVKIEDDKKSFVIDEQPLIRLSLQRSIPVVLFEPNHLLLFHGSPELRRTFLDNLIEQTTPGYSATLRHYKRVLAQRNALLKKNPPGLTEQLFVWNIRLGELGGQIASERRKLLASMQEALSELYGRLSGKQTVVDIHYQSNIPLNNYETALLHKLESSIELDIQRGFTAAGPHRDDIAATINGQPVATAASRGETRTLVLALKIIELDLLELARQQKPILLLDDVFSELDTKRRQALTGHVSNHQTFITTTDADSFAGHFANAKIIKTA
jgi:DNA replication and repair protein RecF